MTDSKPTTNPTPEPTTPPSPPDPTLPQETASTPLPPISTTPLETSSDPALPLTSQSEPSSETPPQPIQTSAKPTLPDLPPLAPSSPVQPPNPPDSDSAPLPPPPSSASTPPPPTKTPPKSKFSIPKQGIIVGAVSLFLVGGLAIGMMLVKTPQDIRQQAAGASSCTHKAGNCDCNSSNAWCNAGSYHSVTFVCDGNLNECRENEGDWKQGGTRDAPTTACGKTVQIDLFDKNCRDGGGWNCGDNNLKGFAVWYTGDCAGGGGGGGGGSSCSTGGTTLYAPQIKCAGDEGGSTNMCDQLNCCADYPCHSWNDPQPDQGPDRKHCYRKAYSCKRDPQTINFVCKSITSSTSSPKIGDQLKFTCTGAGSEISKSGSARFRYQIDGGDFQVITPNASLSKITNNTRTGESATLTVTQPGIYNVQCRICGPDKCTPWGKANVK